MGKSVQYVANAWQCLIMARMASRPDHKQAWLWLGESWLAMVATAERAAVKRSLVPVP
jgi:hypothetical protein